MKSKNKIIAIAMLTAVSFFTTQELGAANLEIGLFSTGNFLVDSTSTVVTSQSGAGLTINANVAAGQNFFGNFTPASSWANYGFTGTLGDYNNVNLGLLMSVTSQAAPLFFTATIYNSAFEVIQRYSGTTSGLNSTPAFVALNPISGSAGPGALTGDMVFELGWDGDGAINTTLVNLQVTTLDAIPEPSVASLLALGTVGLVALRVRRKS